LLATVLQYDNNGNKSNQIKTCDGNGVMCLLVVGHCFTIMVINHNT